MRDRILKWLGEYRWNVIDAIGIGLCADLTHRELYGSAAAVLVSGILISVLVRHAAGLNRH